MAFLLYKKVYIFENDRKEGSGCIFVRNVAYFNITINNDTKTQTLILKYYVLFIIIEYKPFI